jgi:hypothetical protein
MTSDQDAGGAGFGMSVGGIVDDMENGEGSWTHYADTGTDDWAIVTDANAHSPTQCWLGVDDVVDTDKSLVTPAVSVSGSGEFSFWHAYYFETTYDGGVLELSTDGGSSWVDIGALITSGNGYTHTLHSGNPLGARSAWSGDAPAPMQEVTVDLSSYDGQTVNIRFRIGCDYSVGDTGWFIDDVTLDDCQVMDPDPYSCDYIVSPPAGTLPFQINHALTISNDLVGGATLTRKIDARINVTVGNGTTYSNWRGGQTNIAPSSAYTTAWNMTLPMSAVVLGTNTFTMVTEDITPPPYNLPPNPPSGTTCTVSQQVVANAP